MKKQYQNINLNCSFQKSEEPTENQCISGLFSHNSDGSFAFEEVLPRTRDIRNAKLFDGEHISMVRMKNGKLQIHFKVLESVPEDPKQLAFSIYDEVSKALGQII